MSKHKKGYGPRGLSTIQRKMLLVLSDGLPHHRKELHACLWEQEGPFKNIGAHLSAIRKQLPKGHEIICQVLHRTHYFRHIRTLNT